MTLPATEAGEPPVRTVNVTSPSLTTADGLFTVMDRETFCGPVLYVTVTFEPTSWAGRTLSTGLHVTVGRVTSSLWSRILFEGSGTPQLLKRMSMKAAAL